MHPAGEDPRALLDEGSQWTEPWGDSEHGTPCEKCGQTGIAEHNCWSCLLTEAAPQCPVCAGRVCWPDTCPVCRGNGVVDGSRRRGVSVYPRIEGLYHYMLANDADVESCVVVELEGERSPEVDFDADQGALLLIPQAICSCAPPNGQLLAEVTRRASEHRSARG